MQAPALHGGCPKPKPRRFLEEELARRYREAAPATLALLQARCEAVAKELVALEGRIQACSDVAALRRAGGRSCSAARCQRRGRQLGYLRRAC
jgi:hypothetical protein